MTFGQQNTEQEAHEQLEYAVKEAGVNFIDTAELYPVPAREETSTRTESYIGSWLKNQQRESVVLASKVIANSSGLKWYRGGPQPTKEQFRKALEGSLKRLGTDYLDLYQIHWPSRSTPIFGGGPYDPCQVKDGYNMLEQVEVMDEFVKEGKIRHWGLSNEKCWGVMKFNSLCEKNDLAKPVSVQNAYSLINRVYEDSLSETCHRESLGLLAYSPLAFGLLTGKYLDNPESKGRLNEFKGFGYRYGKPNVESSVKEYVKLAKEIGMSPTVMALSFVNDRWFVASNIIGATSMEQLKENLSSASVKLSDEVLKRIDDINLRYPNPAP